MEATVAVAAPVVAAVEEVEVEILEEEGVGWVSS